MFHVLAPCFVILKHCGCAYMSNISFFILPSDLITMGHANGIYLRVLFSGRYFLQFKIPVSIRTLERNEVDVYPVERLHWELKSHLSLFLCLQGSEDRAGCGSAAGCESLSSEVEKGHRDNEGMCWVSSGV